MQERHSNRYLYFEELSTTSREFYISYVREFIDLTPQTRILEIGCGEGGNLLPFAENGCYVMGLDIKSEQIENAKNFFAKNNQKGSFICEDMVTAKPPTSEEECFDIVLIHDVVEHIEWPYKDAFFEQVKRFMKIDAIVFFAFPAWQMPFGGHQQIAQGFASKFAWLHLLPLKLYTWFLRKSKENEECINELISIRKSKMPIEKFEKLYKSHNMQKIDCVYWFINPHYKQKFGLKPKKVISLFGYLPYIRNFYTTSAWFVLKK
ncbi:MAG: class I SAM-dependent methyltransferase [Bacteroidales bacterium]|nr:class I SAM-dependent methyltransferase [Bacteroidales bacterium]